MDFRKRYEFNPKTDLLGKGGFSMVYKANDTLLERTVALKYFTGKGSDKYQVLNEIKKVIRFEHPNLCKYYDVAVLSKKNVAGAVERVEVGIMEYIDGGDFKTYTRRHPQHIDKLLTDVLSGLAYLHRRGMAHRDLKPQNILIQTDEGEPVSKITDFGISKVIAADDDHSSALLGTVEYMAPEQFNPKRYGINGRITTNLDLWSFGLLVYEAVCHESFFGSRSGGVSAEQVMANILSEASLAKADTLPHKYREIVKRCLVKNAAERVQDALELIPLFEVEKTTVLPIYATLEKEPRDASADLTQLIEYEPPVQEAFDKNRDLREASEETQVIDLPAGDDAGGPDMIAPELYETGAQTETFESLPDEENQTDVIEPVSEDMDTETQLIEPLPMTGEVTQVIEPWPEIAGVHTEVIKNKPEAVIGRHNTYAQHNENEKVPPRPVKKIILLAASAVILLALFIAYPLSQPDKETASKPDSTIIAKPPPVEVEDWRPELQPVRGGTFSMGDASANGAKGLQPHTVAVSDFSLGKYEVTVAQFKRFIDETAYKTTAQQKGSSKIYVQGDWVDGAGVDWQHDVQGNAISSNTKNRPVVHVSWRDADAYCQWLSKKTGETYRLPTEAEWEFAAKSGDSANAFSFSGADSINQVAWYKANSGDSIHPVGTKMANRLKIYDMSGNALEWCDDWYDKDYYKKSYAENPKGPALPVNDSAKVARGGGWAYGGDYCRNVSRTWLKADSRGGGIGFRICKPAKF